MFILLFIQDQLHFDKRLQSPSFKRLQTILVISSSQKRSFTYFNLDKRIIFSLIW